MKTKLQNQPSVPIITRIMLRPSLKYYLMCSDETQRSMGELAKTLLFTILFCGSLLALSICNNCFNGGFIYFPLVLIPSALLYYFIDKPIVFTEVKPGQFFLRKWRIFIALALGLFNSFLVDSFYFSKDIAAARNKEISVEENRIRGEYGAKDVAIDANKTILYKQIDSLNGELANGRLALNAEADGSSPYKHAGIGTIYKTKYANYLADSTARAGQIALKMNAVKGIDSIHRVNGQLLNAEIARVPSQFSQGMNKNMELLHEVVFRSGNPTNIMMYLVFFVLTMITELIPLLSKKFYDIAEYFERSAKQKDVKEQEAVLIHTKEMQLLGDKHTLSLRYEQAQIQRDHHLSQLQTYIEFNQSIDQRMNAEFDRLQELDDMYKRSHPRFYESHFKGMIVEAYDKLFNSVKAARI